MIDPVVNFSTYLGGSGNESGFGTAVDLAGNTWIVGNTDSIDFPLASPLQGVNGGESDVFVAKLDATGSNLLYATYLGRSASDTGNGVAIDTAGNAYITGITTSGDFPTANAIQVNKGVGSDAFVTKLNQTGSALVFSTYLGGSSNDSGRAIAVDAGGSAYITGDTPSADFPTVSALQASLGGHDAFLTKLNPVGSALVYSTFLGGDGLDIGYSIAVDGSANAYVAGGTTSTNLPTVNPIQASLAGDRDAFVSKINATGSALLYSTYLGGSLYDEPKGIAVDQGGNAYVTGPTESTNFPIANALQPISAGSDSFVTKLDPAGSTLIHSTYLGGNGSDATSGIAVDSLGNAYVVGTTESTNFPTKNPIQANKGGGSLDAFVTVLNSAGSTLIYSTYLGGNGSFDFGRGIAVDDNGAAYVTGSTTSTNFPTTNPIQPFFAGAQDGFVTKISNQPPNQPPTVDAGGPYGVVEGGAVTVTASGSDPDGGALTFDWDLDNNGSSETPGQTVVFSAAALQAPTSHTITVRVTDNGGLSATDQATVNVIYNFNGFFPPVDNLPVLNAVNAGLAIPVKFSLGGNQGLDIFATGYPKSQQIPCDPTALVDGIEQTVTAGSSSLSYDPTTDQYNYVWKTEKAWANTCRQLVVKLNDNSVHRVDFKFK